MSKCFEDVLKRWEDTRLVLNWEKRHFMVIEKIVIRHKIFHVGLEMDPTKIDVVSNLPLPSDLKPLWSFFGHAGFYRRFIKGFSQIAKPLSSLLGADRPFVFYENCH